jgi:hypothetical protein
MKNQDPGVNITKVTINGRTGYNVTQKSGNSTTYSIAVDIVTSQMEIFPGICSGVLDQKDRAYPVHQMIVNSF